MAAEPMTIAVELPSQAPIPACSQTIPADDDGVNRTPSPLPSPPPSFSAAPPSESTTDTNSPYVSSGKPASKGNDDVNRTPSPSAVPSSEPATDKNAPPVPPSEPASKGKTTYHIYHSGKLRLNFHIYTEPDSSLNSEGVITVPKGHGCKMAHAKLFKDTKHKRIIKLDDPESDPRTPAYFLHKPRIWCREPPQTLRYGGGKDAPVVCLIHAGHLWIKWDLEFAPPEGKDSWVKKIRKLLWGQTEVNEMEKDDEGDEGDAMRVDSGFSEGVVGGQSSTSREEEGDNRTSGEKIPLRRPKSFNDPGVFDRRGVLRSKYPLRSFGLPGETGRGYIREQQELRQRSTNASRGSAAKQPVDDKLPPPLPPHMFPDSLNPTSLTLRWKGLKIREYRLNYRGIGLRWKGTGTVRDPNILGSLCRFNHLKLVAYLPLFSDEPGSALERQPSRRSIWGDDETKDKQDVVLATYTCLWGKRKAGRLEVYELGLEQTVKAIDTAKKEADDKTEAERLRHVVVATGLCMMQGEKEKRDTIKEIILEAAQAPS